MLGKGLYLRRNWVGVIGERLGQDWMGQVGGSGTGAVSEEEVCMSDRT